MYWCDTLQLLIVVVVVVLLLLFLLLLLLLLFFFFFFLSLPLLLLLLLFYFNISSCSRSFFGKFSRGKQPKIHSNPPPPPHPFPIEGEHAYGSHVCRVGRRWGLKHPVLILQYQTNHANSLRIISYSTCSHNGISSRMKMQENIQEQNPHLIPNDERRRVVNASYIQDTYLMSPQAYIVQIHAWMCYEVGFYFSSLESKCLKASLVATWSAFDTTWWLTRCHPVSAGRTSRSEPATHSVIPAFFVSFFRFSAR